MANFILPRFSEYKRIPSSTTPILFAPVSVLSKYFEHARTCAFGFSNRSFGSILVDVKEWLSKEMSVVVKSQEIRVLSDVPFDEMIVDCVLSRIGNTSFTLSQHLVHKKTGKLVVEAAIVVVNINKNTGKSTPFPTKLVEYANTLNLRPVHSKVLNLSNFDSSCACFFLQKGTSWTLPETFAHEFTIYLSDIDSQKHTNHAIIIQFFEDALYMASNKVTGFKNEKNRKMTSQPKTTKVEYINQSYAGQKITVKLWPLFYKDISRENFEEYTNETQLEKDMIGFGGEIRVSNTIICRVILLHEDEHTINSKL